MTPMVPWKGLRSNDPALSPRTASHWRNALRHMAPSGAQGDKYVIPLK